MHTQKSNFQTMKYFFYILMIAILGWFCFMQLFGANEQNYNNPSKSIIYSGSFYWNKEDGTKQKIDIPGTYEVKPGHTMVLTTTLPKDYDETTFAIQSSLQDIQFYVGNSLRAQYSTKDTRMAGKNSASRYIFCPTTYKDAGKTLRIELTTYTSNYSGIVNEVYCGNKAEIWQYIYIQYLWNIHIYCLLYLIYRYHIHPVWHSPKKCLPHNIRHGILWMVYAHGLYLDAWRIQNSTNPSS